MFATGGASGAVGLGLYIIYRFFFSKHRITSRCCGREMSIDVEGSTPRINNVKSIVEDAIRPEEGSDARRCTREGQGPVAPLEGGDGCGVSGGAEGREDEPNAQEKGSQTLQSRVQEGEGDPPRSRRESGEL